MTYTTFWQKKTNDIFKYTGIKSKLRWNNNKACHFLNK